jgi:HD-GYP domain-containing protein (c-di-GMP phosphodiesterase class II)
MTEPEDKKIESTAKAEVPLKDPRALQKAGVDLLIRFHILYKLSKIYDLKNDILQEQAKVFHDSLSAFLETGEPATFKIRQGMLFFNGIRLKFVLTSYPIFKFIIEEFKKKEIGALVFRPGLTREELVSFTAYLSRKEKKAKMSFEELLREAREAGYGHIDLEKILPAETPVNPEKESARLFFLSVTHLKEAFEKDTSGEKIKLTTTRRLMQSIFNHIVDNESFICGLTNIKNYDEYTLNHSVNVCMLSIALGRRLGLTRGELVDLGVAAFFHDLGKLDTPLEILNKPSKLSDAEREVMERHPHQGAEKLLRLKEFKRLPLRAIHVTLEHHIKEDFTGYPKYLKKGTTNLFSKIVKVVDYFDAITTKRIYRKKVFTRAEALSLMLEQSRAEFHPLILKSFVGLIGIYPVGSVVALSTEEIGIVVETNADAKFVLRPKVKLITNREGHKVDGDVVDLTDKDEATQKFRRTIVKAIDPDRYGIKVPDYFLARAQS